ncbi:MAG TPA: hypothetical protein VD758_06620 [Gemmatimonadaceae bacterium]|nr:hypothetical protein [Gemmatimonadaceae bacterium]
MSAHPIVAGARRAGSQTALLVARNGHQGDIMRSSICFILAIAALLAFPETISAQPKIGSSVYATFERSGANTELIGLAVGDIAPGTKVTINCSGTSCPFSSKTITVQETIKMLAITDMFVETTFKAGTTIEIRVAKPGTIGISFSYETQSSADPKVVKQCLAADNSKAVAC